jgi:glycosyltransferase involved in cell wall biosynthesis
MNYTLAFEKNSSKAMFSFIIPTYNRIALLKRAIESITKLELKINYEIVIVDNNSNIEISNLFIEYLKEEKWSDECSVRYYYFNNSHSMYQNWNNGINFSSAHYYTILNDDDILLPGFKKLINYTLVNKPLKAICGTISYWDGNSYIKFKKRNKLKMIIFKILSSINFYTNYSLIRGFYGNPIPGSLAAIFNKAIINKIGLYDTEFGISADYDFNSKCLTQVGILRFYELSGLYFLHDNTSSSITTTKKFIIESSIVRTSILNKIGFKKELLKKVLLIKQSIFLYEHSEMFKISQINYMKLVEDFQLLYLNKSRYLFNNLKLKILLNFKLIK